MPRHRILFVVALQKLAVVLLAVSLLSGASGAQQLCDLRCSQGSPQTHHHSAVPHSHSMHHHSMEGQSAAVLHPSDTDSFWGDRSACREYAAALALAETSRLSLATAVDALSPSVEVQPIAETESRSTIYKSPPYAFLFRVIDVALRI